MKNIYVALENIRSLYNVGAIIRTCSFFGIRNLILVGYSGKHTLPGGKVMLHEKVKKVSLGAENDLDILFLENANDLVDFAKKHKLDLIAIEQNEASIPLKTWRPTDNCIFVFGNEVTGITTEALHRINTIVEIPRIGTHNSLNVATCCGIFLANLTLI